MASITNPAAGDWPERKPEKSPAKHSVNTFCTNVKVLELWDILLGNCSALGYRKVIY
ncbi:hypothetical protein KKF97_08225 [Myxococcota bacterium]|nr:hypothetical protein [Myxococcota bacterium]MBU1380275.1 hypothetical protein [Myxococcota bacterium]